MYSFDASRYPAEWGVMYSTYYDEGWGDDIHKWVIIHGDKRHTAYSTDLMLEDIPDIDGNMIETFKRVISKQ